MDTPSQTATRSPSSRPASTRSAASQRPSSRTSDESTPLLQREHQAEPDEEEADDSAQTSQPSGLWFFQRFRSNPSNSSAKKAQTSNDEAAPGQATPAIKARSQSEGASTSKAKATTARKSSGARKTSAGSKSAEMETEEVD